MSSEEMAADLSVRRDRLQTSAENREKNVFPATYVADETIDLSTKKRPPVIGDSKFWMTPEGPSSTQSLEIGMHRVQIMDQRTRDRILFPTRSQPPRAARYAESYSMSSGSSPDVIILSDEEGHHMNGHVNGYDSDLLDSSESGMEMPPPPKLKELSEEEWRERERKIRKLREELRNEEMKLVLLKKLRQSQTMKENLIGSSASAVSGKVSLPVGRASTAQATAPAPLLRGGHMSGLHGKFIGHQPQQSPLMMPPLATGQSIHGPPPPHSLLMGSRMSGSSTLPANVLLQQSMMRSGMGSTGRTPVTTPPNVVMGYPVQPLMSNQSGSQSSSLGLVQSTSQVPPTASPTPRSSGENQSERGDNQTPAQRQAAAKLALRKQLEKTLLQIPPPKPPPPEMHFIPNANNQEFVYLLGLEVVVNLLTEDPNANKSPPDPFECVQCNADFTPVWKWQEASMGGKRPAVICENCMTTNIKKALKAEHTNRLKTAFVKALQQEQEIEQRMSQVTASPPPMTPPATTPPAQPLPSTHVAPVTCSGLVTSTTSHNSIASMLPRIGTTAASSAGLLQMPKLTAAQQSLLQAQAQLQQLAQGLPQHQPQPAHMLPFAPLLAAQASYYQMLGKSPVTSVDLQRQYLLDMIPPRSLPQSSMNWKT